MSDDISNEQIEFFRNAYMKYLNKVNKILAEKHKDNPNKDNLKTVNASDTFLGVLDQYAKTNKSSEELSQSNNTEQKKKEETK